MCREYQRAYFRELESASSASCVRADLKFRLHKLDTYSPHLPPSHSALAR